MRVAQRQDVEADIGTRVRKSEKLEPAFHPFADHGPRNLIIMLLILMMVTIKLFKIHMHATG